MGNTEQKIITEKAALIELLQLMLTTASLIDIRNNTGDPDEYLLSNSALVSNIYNSIPHLRDVLENVADACNVEFV